MFGCSLDEQESDITDTFIRLLSSLVINWYSYAQIRQKLYCNYRLLVEYDLLLCCSAENCNITMFGCSLDGFKFRSQMTKCMINSHKRYPQITCIRVTNMETVERASYICSYHV